MSIFSFKMFGILEIRIPRCCNSGWKTCSGGGLLPKVLLGLFCSVGFPGWYLLCYVFARSVFLGGVSRRGFDGSSWKNIFFIRYPKFQLKNAWNLYSLNFAIIWRIKLNKCLFSSQFSTFGVELCQKSTVWCLFIPKKLRLSATIWKFSDYLPEMSGILDTRILPFCNSSLGPTFNIMRTLFD